MTATPSPSDLQRDVPAKAVDAAYAPPPVAMAPPRSTTRRFTTWRSISALMLREMSTSYGRTPGGYAWEILEPALGIALLTAIFSAGFRSPPLGTNFAIFYATGMVAYQMWGKLSTNVANAVGFSKQFLAYPAVTFIDTLLARFLLAMITQAVVSYLLIAGIRMAYDTQTVLVFSRILTGYLMTVALALSIGLMNAFMFQRYPLYKNVYGIMTRPLLFISGIIFLYDTFPEPYKSWLWWNPLIHCIGMIRSGFYLHYEAEYASPTYVFIVSGLLAVTGVLFLTRYIHDILEA